MCAYEYEGWGLYIFCVFFSPFPFYRKLYIFSLRHIRWSSFQILFRICAGFFSRIEPYSMCHVVSSILQFIWMSFYFAYCVLSHLRAWHQMIWCHLDKKKIKIKYKYMLISFQWLQFNSLYAWASLNFQANRFIFWGGGGRAWVVNFQSKLIYKTKIKKKCQAKDESGLN